jgi:hypothetical protein
LRSQNRCRPVGYCAITSPGTSANKNFLLHCCPAGRYAFPAVGVLLAAGFFSIQSERGNSHGMDKLCN